MIDKILIIDDEEVWGSLTKRMLAIEMPGCEVETASTGAEGLVKARAFLPDVIVLDVMLPGENGWEIAAALKNDERTAGIPIIIASGAGSPFSNEQHVEHDLVVDYIRKPFDVDLLLNTIRKALNQ
ncbi:MAG: response regulator [Kiritimatiellae bacterium]|nr:response regulator [Kiritimatiellia bacterium]